jgi:hypothetical protein
MPFNSSALSAGIGSMLQGIQQNAQEKLQLAQMARQQRIEDKRLADEQAMNDINRQIATEGLNQTRVINPITADMARSQLSLARGLMPHQIESARLGVVGQDIGNRANLFQVEKMQPEQLISAQTGNRFQKAQADVAEALVPTNIKAGKQSVEANELTASERVRQRYQGALGQVKTAASILKNPQATHADKLAAYNEYQKVVPIIRGAIGDVDAMARLGSLFGDRATIMQDVRTSLGIPPTVTDDQLQQYLMQLTPDVNMPSPADDPARFAQIQGMLSGVLGPRALSPAEGFVDYVPPTLSGNRIVGGGRLPQINTYRLAEASFDEVLNEIRKAKSLGYTPKAIWQTIGNFTDKDFDASGNLNVLDKDIKKRAIQAIATNFRAPQGTQDALIKYQSGYEDKVKMNLQARIAEMNSAMGNAQANAQLKAAMATTSLPLVNVWTDTFRNGYAQLDKLATDGIALFGFDIKSDLPGAFLTKIKDTKDAKTIAQAKQFVARYEAMQTALKESNSIFGKTQGINDTTRVSNALHRLVKVGISIDPTLLQQSGLAGGAPAPAPAPANSNFGISGGNNISIDPLTLPGGGKPPMQ